MGVNDLALVRRLRAPAAGTPTPIRTRRAALALAGIVAILAGCAAGAAPAASAAASAAQSIDNAFEAAEAVAQQNRLLAGVGPQESDAIGQANYWAAERTADGYRVRYTVGWGDCMAGCIESHEFTYDVRTDGLVRLVSEEGAAIPADVIDRLAQGGDAPGQGVTGRVVAGPVCPVERPDDPSCAPKPVPGAVLILRSADGSTLRVEADESGLFSVELPPGEYVVEGQPVEGLMGAPAPVTVVVEEGAATAIELEYDTGIR
jgi:hypothetical protein